MRTNPQLRATLVLVMGVISLGFSGIFVSWANAPGAVTGFYRMGSAALVLSPLFVRRLRAVGRLPRREAALAVAGGLFFGADMIFWNSGILISGAANPTLMGNTSPLWVGLGAYFFFRERQNRTFWAGVALAMTGAAIILGRDALNNVGMGTLFGLLAGMFYGGYFLVMEASRRQLDALTSFWLALVSGSLLLLLVSLLLGQPLTGYSRFTYLNFVALGLVVQAFGQLALNYALGYLPASIVSPTALGQPVLTAVLAIPLLGQPLHLWQVVGGVIVLSGALMVHRSRFVTTNSGRNE